MTVSTRSFTDLVRGLAAAIQGRASGLVDVSVGAIVRAAIEATAGVVLWLQALILNLLATTRAATSSGADLDSWMADWFFTRLPATGASGLVTFSRFTATGQVVVPIGASVETADGTQKYVVVVDTSNSDYDALLGGYVLIAGAHSVDAPVEAVSLSSAGNALAGTINTITSALPGVDTVTNAAGFTNGADAEADAAFRARFQGYLQSLREATPAALLYFVRSIKQGVQAVLVENLTLLGVAKRGFIYLIVDDGTGAPPADLVTEASAVVDLHRAAGVEYAVYAAQATAANLAGTITTAAGADHAAAVAAVGAAWAAYRDSLALEATLYLTRLYAVAYEASTDVIDVTGITINSGSADLVPARGHVVKGGTSVAT